MKTFLLIVIVAVLGFFGYPLVSEDTTSECDALERLAVRVIADTGRDRPRSPDSMAGQALGQLLQGTSRGQFAQVAARNQFPNLPVSVTCSMLYWKALADPEGFRRNPGRLHL